MTTPSPEAVSCPRGSDKLLEIQAGLKTIQDTIRGLSLSLKSVQKEVKQLETFQAKHKKKVRPPREPSGFARKLLISDELYGFLGLPVGTEIAGTKVTKMINAYIKEKNLQNPENRREILPDPALKAILECGDETVTYFNMQRFLRRHYK